MIEAVRGKGVFSRDEQRQKKRLAVLHTGARLFSEKGFDRTSLDEIATELDVSKRTLYYYVDSKDDILFECIRRAFDFLDDAMRQSNDSEKSPLVRIRAFFRRYARVLSNDYGACLVRCQDDVLSEESRSVLHDGYKKIDSTVRSLLQAGIDDGSIAPCDTKYTAAALFGAFNWVPYWNRKGDEDSFTEIADHFLDVFLEGLKAR